MVVDVTVTEGRAGAGDTGELMLPVVDGNLLLSKLALKHRQGKNHKMRIIAFVGSPVEDQEKDVSLQSSGRAYIWECPQVLRIWGKGGGLISMLCCPLVGC